MTGPGAARTSGDCLHLVISGRVQGVWYRGWMVREARAEGLAGWVRNRGDGTVEAMVGGPSQALHRFVHACRGGPPAARVTAVDQRPSQLAPAALPYPFEQRPSR